MNFSRPLWINELERKKELFWLDKNEITLEKALDFNISILKRLKPLDLSVYPDLGRVYINLEKIFGINENNSLLVNGADGGIREVFLSLCNRYQAVILDPTFAMISVYPNNMKNNYIKVNYELINKKPRIDIDKLIGALSSTSKPPLLVIASPDSPTGNVIEIDEINFLLGHIRKYDGIMLFDGTYALYKSYKYMLEIINIINNSNNALFTTSFSKSPGLAGLRLGFLMGSIDLIDKIRSIRPMYEIGAVQARIIEIVLDQWKNCLETIEEINQNKTILEELLENSGCEIIPAIGNFTLFRSNKKIDNILNQLCYYKKNFESNSLKGLSRLSSPPNAFIKTLEKKLL